MSATRGNHPDGSEGSTVVPLHPHAGSAPGAAAPAPQAASETLAPSPPITTLVVQAAPNAAADDEHIFKLQVQLDMQRERALLYRVSAAVLGVAAMMVLREWLILLVV